MHPIADSIGVWPTKSQTRGGTDDLSHQDIRPGNTVSASDYSFCGHVVIRDFRIAAICLCLDRGAIPRHNGYDSNGHRRCRRYSFSIGHSSQRCMALLYAACSLKTGPMRHIPIIERGKLMGIISIDYLAGIECG